MLTNLWSYISYNNEHLKNEIKKIHNNIDESHIYDVGGNVGGLEDFTHLTTMFSENIDSDDVSVKLIINDIVKKFDIDCKTYNKSYYTRFIRLSLFENDDYDVLKYDVECPFANNIFKHLSNKFIPLNKEYKPHVTIGYIKKGYGRRYIKDITPFYCIISEIGAKINLHDNKNKHCSINI